jgi:predicted dehydrogenase
MKTYNRRKFIRATATTGLGFGVMQAASFNILKNFPAKDKYRIAVMGVNGRGTQHVQGFASLSNVEVAYICDVDSRAIENAKGFLPREQQGKVKGLGDFRKALDDKSIDAITIAMPDHWHAPAALLGLSAGKHVYVEKPGSHNPAEATLLSQAASSSDKVVQMGNQRRSWPRVQEAIAELHNGALGKVYYARTWYTNNRQSIGKGKEEEVPAWLDYELWQGPAPRKKYKDNVIHYNWHWFWNWGTGELLNNGTHYIDLARWGLQAEYPVKVYSTGGRYQYQDDWQTPDTQLATFDFEGGKTIMWEGRSCNRRGINEMGSGVSFHGEKGSLELLDNSYTIFDNDNKLVKSAESQMQMFADTRGQGMAMDVGHFTNFINGIDKGGKLYSPYSEIAKSVHLCHLGNISYRTGRSLNIDNKTGQIINDADAMKLWSREYEKGWEPKA